MVTDEVGLTDQEGHSGIEMRILRVITRLNVGGPAIQAISLSRELADLGHECVLLHGSVADHEGDMKHMLPSNVFSFNVPGLKRDTKGVIEDLSALAYLRTFIKETKPDIVHTHMSKAGFITRLAALTVKPRPKLVHTYHGHVLEGYFSRSKSRLYAMLERWLARYTDRLIAISEGQMNELYGRYKIGRALLGPHPQWRVVPNGFDLSEFLKLKTVELNGKAVLNVGIVGRLTAIKNHKLFIEFLEELSKQVSVVGYIDGDGELADEVKLMAHNARVPIIFDKGFIEYEDMPKHYEHLDVVVCSSINEGTPTTLIEAMAAGRLVVATPVGGNVDLLSSNYMGSWCTRGIRLNNPRKAALALKHALETDVHSKMVSSAREHVRKTHSLDRLTADIVALYKEVLKC